MESQSYDECSYPIRNEVYSYKTGDYYKEIKKVKIPIPPIELQNKFAERAEKIEKLSFIILSVIFKIFEILKKKGVENN